MLKCKHQCRCACSSEIGTCIINDAGKQAVLRKTTKTTKTHVLFYVLKLNTCNNAKKKQKQKHYTLNILFSNQPFIQDAC